MHKLRKIENLISPISGSNYEGFKQAKVVMTSSHALERISELTENNENIKEGEGLDMTEKMSQANEKKEIDMLKEIMMSSINHNSINLNIEQNDESLNKPAAASERNTTRRRTKLPSWSKVTFKDDKHNALKQQASMIKKYRHLFEDVEEPSSSHNNPKTGRAHYSSFRRPPIKEKENEIESDFTSFRQQGNNTHIMTDLSLDKITTNFRAHNELVQDGCLINIDHGSHSFIMPDSNLTRNNNLNNPSTTKSSKFHSSLFKKESERTNRFTSTPSPLESVTTRNE